MRRQCGEEPHIEVEEGAKKDSLKWTPKSGYRLAKLSYAARRVPVVNPPAQDVKLGAGGGSILGSLRCGLRTALRCAPDRAAPSAPASQNRPSPRTKLDILGRRINYRDAPGSLA